MAPKIPIYPIENIIIGLILQKKKYGYQIYKELVDKVGLGSIWSIRESQMYLILKKMCQEGLICEEKEENIKGRVRKSYDATAVGIDQFNEWILSPVIYPRNFMQEFLPKYYLCDKYKIVKLDVIRTIQVKKVNQWTNDLSTKRNRCGNKFQHKLFKLKFDHVATIKKWLEEELV